MNAITTLKKVRIALLAFALCLIPAFAHAQQRQPAAPNVAATVWMGSENLNGFGKLGFAFRNDGVVFMADARSNDNDPKTFVRGTWVQNGADVEIHFKDCVYRGRITGQELAGTAQFRNGQGQPWSFRVQFMPAQMPTGQPR